MESINIEGNYSSNDEDDDIERESEIASLKKDGKKRNNSYKKKKQLKIQNISLVIFFYILVFFILFLLFEILILQINTEKPKINQIKNNFNLRSTAKNNNTNTNIFNKEVENIIEQTDEIEIQENIPIIDDIKNLDIKPLDDTFDSLFGQNKTDRKIVIAFFYYNLHANGIGRFITVTANNLIKTGKYDIYFITEQPPSAGEFSYDSRIKRIVGYNNYTLMEKIFKKEIIDIAVLQNVLSPSAVKFHRKFGQKVICMFHGVFLSAIVHNLIENYRSWDKFDYCDAFIFIAADDYYIYKKLGFQNEIFVPNLYTFEPSEVKSSNLTNKNIVILGRLNDHIKGIIYAIKAMFYIVKEVPDAMLYLISSDSRIQFLRDLTKELNLTKNIIFRGGVKNISAVFWNSSIHMFTSLSEAFPMVMNEGKAHGMPIVGFDVPYSLPYQQGFIGVELFDVKGLAKETVKLLKDYEYRKKMGEISKKSLDVFKNNETVELWGRLCDSLLSDDRNDFRKLQKDIEKKYYNETKAREHLESQFNILIKQNINLTCLNFDNFLDVNYLKNIKNCNFTALEKNNNKTSNKT